MNQDSVKLEVRLYRITRDAKIIMWLSVLSLIALPLFLIALIYFLFYNSKFLKLKNNQSLSGIFNRLKGKTIKELKSIRGSGEPLEQLVAGLLLTHKSMVAVLIVIGIIITILIAVISIYYLMGWQVT
jgi:hypothetical protein